MSNYLDLSSPHSNKPEPTLVLLCKRPRLGQGKQRLAATLGTQTALVIAQHLLACALEDLAAWDGVRVISPASAADANWAAEQLPDATCVAQTSGNLGERILELDNRLRTQGHQRLIYIGSDAPVLGPRLYAETITELASYDSVFSAAEDGGVTIMASNRPWPNALVDLPWSTESLGAALAGACKLQGQHCSWLAPSYDIDHAKDLQRLQHDLRGDSRPARQRLVGLLTALALDNNAEDLGVADTVSSAQGKPIDSAGLLQNPNQYICDTTR